jgi:predicted flap endonuclease-1-like 5' DNA nuclease
MNDPPQLMMVSFAVAAQGLEPMGTPLWFFIVLGLIILAILIWALLSRSWETTVAEQEQAARMAAPVIEPESEPMMAGPEPMMAEPEPMMAGPEPMMAEPEPMMAEPETDDLLLIEGIGPKIKQVLADAGITTFAALAETDMPTLERIVQEEAGITIAHPDTWPRQARLAAAGDWDGFQQFVDRLKGGREVEPD